MAKPTLSETVHDLLKSSATLAERVENHRAALARLEVAQEKMSESLSEDRRALGVLEERLNEFKKVYEEASRRNWMILVAFVGCLLTLFGNILFTLWRK